MLLSLTVALLIARVVFGATVFASHPPVSTINPPASQITAIAATATPISPVSHVKGAIFDRFIQIWLENTDYAEAASNVDLKFFASQGITLTNYWAITHPSQPNYCAVAGGDVFGMDGDGFKAIPANVSTVVDLLDTKGISWGEYQEDIPYPGFQGFNFSNQATFANAYVRKHNPLILFDSVTKNETRLKLIKGFGDFKNDFAKKTLPQWSFLTPNMINDGHDTNITFASAWERGFLTDMLNDTYFMNNTLILLTFDEIDTRPEHNKVYSILLGGAIPSSLKGAIDNTFYTHYSTLSTVSANWGLPSLGRWDCAANVFQLVANKTGYTNYDVNTTNLFLNSTSPGPLSDKSYIPDWPVPDISAKCASGMGVLDIVKTTYAGMKPTFNYSRSPFPYDDVGGVNTGVPTTLQNSPSSTTSSAPGATSSKASASVTADVRSILPAVLSALVALFI